MNFPTYTGSAPVLDSPSPAPQFGQDDLSRAARRSGEMDAYKIYLAAREIGFLPNIAANSILAQMVDVMAEARAYGERADPSYREGLQRGVRRFLPEVAMIAGMSEKKVMPETNTDTREFRG